MHQKYLISGLVVAVGVLVLIAPAQAIDLRFSSFFNKFAPIEQVKADENNVIIAPLNSSQQIITTQPQNPEQIVQPINKDNSTNNNPSPATCRVNDTEVPCPGANNQQQSNQPGGQFMPPGQQGQMGQPQQPNQPGQPGPNEEQMAKQQVQHLKDMQKSVKPLKNSLATFEKLMAKGNTLSDALQAKIVQAKDLVAKIENAKTADEISNDDMDNLRELMNNLQEEQQSMQRLTEFRKNIGNTERGVKNFESQLTRLQKQKLIVPADITENLNKIKQLIAIVKTAKSWEEMQAAGVEDMGDLMQTLNESRNNLEMLARWPQTLKQIDKELANLTRQVKKAKTTVDRLLKKEIDLTENYNKFVEMATKLKAVRDDAVAKIAAGDSESAFNLAQDDFFGQMEETYQNMQVIEMMNNLGAFTSSFKSELNKAKQQINQLKKKKIDITELQAIYDRTKVKGDETLALIKVKPIDQDVVQSAMEELGDLRVEFGDKVSELTGDDNAGMPWQQGPQQFKQVQMTQNFNQFFPQQPQPIQKQNSEGNNGSTCNVNGVEISGPCN